MYWLKELTLIDWIYIIVMVIALPINIYNLISINKSRLGGEIKWWKKYFLKAQ